MHLFTGGSLGTLIRDTPYIRTSQLRIRLTPPRKIPRERHGRMDEELRSVSLRLPYARMLLYTRVFVLHVSAHMHSCVCVCVGSSSCSTVGTRAAAYLYELSYRRLKWSEPYPPSTSAPYDAVMTFPLSPFWRPGPTWLPATNYRDPA